VYRAAVRRRGLPPGAINHSQSFGRGWRIPRLKVIMLRLQTDAKGLAHQVRGSGQQNPVVGFLEHKLPLKRLKGPVPDGDVHRLPIGTGR